MHVITSTGLVITRIIDSGAYFATNLAYFATIFALGTARSIRVISGVLGTPAAIITILESAISSKFADGVMDTLISLAARASFMSKASPWILSKLFSRDKSTILLTTLSSAKQKETALPTLPDAPITLTFIIHPDR